MKAFWFKKHGYKKADRDSISLLVWKPISEDAAQPSWVRPKKSVPTRSGKVVVTAFINGWCPSQNVIFERAKRACSTFGDKVLFDIIDTSEKENFSNTRDISP